MTHEVLEHPRAAQRPIPSLGRAAREPFKGGLAKPAAIAAVDLGAAKIACFVMKADGVRRSERTLTAAGVGYVASRGVRGGAVTDIDAAAHSIAQAVERAEALAGVSVQAVTVATAGGQLASHRLTAQVNIGGGRPIAEADLARATAQAMAGARFDRRAPIHLRPVGWSVDGEKRIADPVGLFGRTLRLDLIVVTMNEAAFHTIGHCVERAHLAFEGVVAAPYVAALAALEDDEMELGAICIDMGAGATSAAVFSGGALIHVDSLAVGGQHVTQDVARGLSTSLAGAERIKTLHGSAIASANEDREMVEAPPRGDDPAAGPVIAPRSLLKGIIGPRVEETFDLLRERLKAAEALREPGAGIVLTGGASQLSGVREVAVRVFDRPVRLGRPRRVPHLAQAAAGPAFCAAAGALHRAAFGPKEAAPKRPAAHPADPHGGVFARTAAWLRDNL